MNLESWILKWPFPLFNGDIVRIELDLYGSRVLGTKHLTRSGTFPVKDLHKDKISASHWPRKCRPIYICDKNKKQKKTAKTKIQSPAEVNRSFLHLLVALGKPFGRRNFVGTANSLYRFWIYIYTLPATWSFFCGLSLFVDLYKVRSV